MRNGFGTAPLFIPLSLVLSIDYHSIRCSQRRFGNLVLAFGDDYHSLRPCTQRRFRLMMQERMGQVKAQQSKGCMYIPWSE
jgi:hypothetical protein